MLTASQHEAVARWLVFKGQAVDLAEARSMLTKALAHAKAKCERAAVSVPHGLVDSPLTAAAVTILEVEGKPEGSYSDTEFEAAAARAAAMGVADDPPAPDLDESVELATAAMLTLAAEGKSLTYDNYQAAAIRAERELAARA